MELVIVLLVVVAIVLLAAVAYMQWRSWSLRRRFGPEYERAVAEHGSRRSAEAGLREMARRRAELDVVDLTPEARATFTSRWRDVQLRFVDEPAESVGGAETLVNDVLRARGYALDDFDDRVAMVAVDHPDVADDFRTAHAIHDGHDGGAGSSDIDELRDAFVRYRGLFERLVGTDGATPVGAAPDGSSEPDEAVDAEHAEPAEPAEPPAPGTVRGQAR